ncbi:MAG TPA: hypothetical protein VGL88_07545, partial [Pseudonocardiaceae bacterium]
MSLPLVTETVMGASAETPVAPSGGSVLIEATGGGGGGGEGFCAAGDDDEVWLAAHPASTAPSTPTTSRTAMATLRL